METKKAYMIISYETLNPNHQTKMVEFKGEVVEFAPKEVDGEIAYENEDYFLSLAKKSKQTGTQTLAFTKPYQFFRFDNDQYIKLIYIVFEDIILYYTGIE